MTLSAPAFVLVFLGWTLAVFFSGYGAGLVDGWLARRGVRLARRVGRWVLERIRSRRPAR